MLVLHRGRMSGVGAQTPSLRVGYRRTPHGGDWQGPQRAPAGSATAHGDGSGRPPSISGVGWRCLSCFHMLLLL